MQIGNIGILLCSRNCPAINKRLRGLTRGASWSPMLARDLVWRAGQLSHELEREGFTPIMGAEAVISDYHAGARGLTYTLRFAGPSWELVSIGQVDPIVIPTEYRADSDSQWGSL